MYALFAGSNDPEIGIAGGIQDLQAVKETIPAAQEALRPEDDWNLDWAHVVDLDDPKLVIVAEWQRPVGWTDAERTVPNGLLF